MKNFKILALALAMTFGFSSCSNNDQVETPATGDDFNVTFSLVKSKTYADGPTATVGDKVVISDGYLFFTNDTDMITDVYTIKAGAIAANKEIEATGLGLTPTTLNKVSGASTKVYLLANIGTLTAKPAIGASAVVFMKNSMIVEDQGTHTGVTSAGNTALVATSNPDERTAAITLSTNVARIQLNDIILTNFTSGKVEGIFINNYYPTMELGGTVIENLIGSTDKADYISPDSPIFTNNLLTYVFDYGINGDVTALVKPTTANGVWGYNLFVSATPQIIIKFTDVKAFGQTLGEQYVTINGFKDSSNVNIDTLVGGNIYTIAAGTLAIDAGDLNPEPGMNSIKVDVTVTTVTWAETVVTPNM